MEHLERAPVGSISYHTHSVFLRHHQVAGASPNDFANWVASQVRDQVLGERLAVVDPFAFETLEDLREEFVSIIDHHLATVRPVPRVIFGDPFFFVQSHVIAVPAGLKAHTLGKFRRWLAEMEASSISFHGLESRVRRGRCHGDFADGIARALRLYSLAEQMGHVNPYLGGLEEAPLRMLRLLDATLAAEEPSREREAGREHARQSFLITRHLRDSLSLLVHLTA